MKEAGIDSAREWIGQGGIILLAGVGERPIKTKLSPTQNSNATRIPTCLNRPSVQGGTSVTNPGS